MYESWGEPSLFRRYLTLLRVEPTRPSYTALEELVAAHVMTIPFENISKLHYLRRGDLRYMPSLEQYLTGIERFNFGGTCYSNNYYFHQLLKYLGFQVMLCGADIGTPDSHLVNIVSVDDREFLVDTGYAAPFMAPLPRDLATDYEVQLGRDRYVLKPRDGNGCSRMELYRDGELIHGYTAKPIPRQIEHFAPIIERSFRDEATFMNSLLLVRFYEGRSSVIFNLSVIESEGSSYSIQTLPSKAELPTVVERSFGIPVDIAREAISMLGELRSAWN